MKIWVISALLLLSGLTLSACNTVEGMGRDIEKAGESIQKL
ncbi:MAG: entericidin A/B family lipoprotein [Rhodospirillales bacterium]|nr:entericidin A/B family lipoprotein [Rhodospirillales bacterium]MCB9996991.1 entericidin A/B family lipoprotein [Rhodospirillales bacterium]